VTLTKIITREGKSCHFRVNMVEEVQYQPGLPNLIASFQCPEVVHANTYLYKPSLSEFNPNLVEKVLSLRYTIKK